jgi:hypothetical protein
MQNILINVKSRSKYHFLMELLSQFDFIEIKQPVPKGSIRTTTPKSIDVTVFRKTAGIWKDRNFDVEKYIRDLRKGKRLYGYEK